MPVFLKNYFNRRAEERGARQLRALQRKAHLRQGREMIAAIQARDVNAIERIWDRARDKDAFLKEPCRTTSGSFYSTLYGDFLIEAIRTKDLDVFRAVFQANPDPNLLVHRWYQVPLNILYQNTPLLSLSIQHGSRDIALFLARHPALNPALAGNYDDGEWCNFLGVPSDSREFPRPIALASGTSGMEEVVAALGNRQLLARHSAPEP